jgi:general secretion pathway protein D
VIGGLMQERADSTTSKVPILGDIPILGHLFKYTRKTKKKTNLVIMLTPYIIKDQLDLQALRERKVREHEEFAGSLVALRSMQYQPKMDYQRKRGLVEEINRVLVDVETDLLARKALHAPQTVAPGPIEY